MEEEEIFSHSLVVTCFSVLPLLFYPQIAYQHQPPVYFSNAVFANPYVLMQSGCNGRRRRRRTKNSSLPHRRVRYRDTGVPKAPYVTPRGVC